MGTEINIKVRRMTCPSVLPWVWTCSGVDRMNFLSGTRANYTTRVFLSCIDNTKFLLLGVDADGIKDVLSTF